MYVARFTHVGRYTRSRFQLSPSLTHFGTDGAAGRKKNEAVNRFDVRKPREQKKSFAGLEFGPQILK